MSDCGRNVARPRMGGGSVGRMGSSKILGLELWSSGSVTWHNQQYSMQDLYNDLGDAGKNKYIKA